MADDWAKKLEQQLNEKEAAAKQSERMRLMMQDTLSQKTPDLFRLISNDIQVKLPMLIRSHPTLKGVCFENTSENSFKIDNPNSPAISVCVTRKDHEILIEFSKASNSRMVRAVDRHVVLSVNDDNDVIMSHLGKHIYIDDVADLIVGPVLRLAEV